MTEIRKPAVKILQGKRTLFLTSLVVRDFTANFYRVDRLDVQGSSGMQRLLNQSRAKSFGKDIVGADNENAAFLPTSVFLATSGSISYDEHTKELFFDTDAQNGICPLDVVDGQHRIEGLKLAANQNHRLLDFPIATVISSGMSEAEKMLQFVTVNTKQQSIDKGVAQHIIARFTQMLEVENLPYLPAWLKKAAEKGDDDKAIDIAKYLNTDEESPWRGRIRFADEDRKPRHTINQASFVKSIKRVVLAKNYPLRGVVPDESKRRKILRNYWIAIEEIFISSSDNPDIDAGKESVVFKSIGLEFFHAISGTVINQLARNNGAYTVAAIKICLLSAEDLPAHVAGIMFPEYWQSGKNASGLNSGAIAKLAADFSDAITAANSRDINI